jgi:N4-gp56 family major capsid protein
MAEVTLATASEKQVWINKYFQEYIRASGFLPYMSNADLNKGGIILTRYELQEEAGKTINIPFIGRLKGAGVTGSSVLDGNEEELTNYNCKVSVDWRRNGVRVPKSTSFKTEINLLNAAKDGLKEWEREKLRDDVIKAFMQVVTGGTDGDTVVQWADATAGNKNTWCAANSDRLLFGALKSNYSATYATAIANVDTTNDKATAATMSLAKRMAKNADPHIRPYTTEDGREYYVAFHGSRSFRDLKADSTIVQANRDARAREGSGMDKNPIFQDGDIIYDGIIHREVPEIDNLCTAVGGWDGVGAASCDVRPVFLCGGGAVAIAWGQEPTPKTDYLKDFGFRPGVAIEELLGVRKIAYNGVQNGVLTVFVAAAADS